MSTKCTALTSIVTIAPTTTNYSNNDMAQFQILIDLTDDKPKETKSYNFHNYHMELLPADQDDDGDILVQFLGQTENFMDQNNPITHSKSISDNYDSDKHSKCTKFECNCSAL